MKRFLLYTITILSMIVFYSLCYYFSFLGTMKKAERSAREQDRNLMQILLEEDLHGYPTPTGEINESGSVSVATKEDAIIQSGTKCVFEHYYIDTGEISVMETGPTAELAGLSREQLLDKLVLYMENLSFTEYEAGLVSYELRSFSPERVVLRKTYDRNRLQFRFYLTVKNNRVIVYYSDCKTIYEYTGIEITEINEQNRILLIEGIFIKDTEELYDILAGLTS